MLCPNCDTTLKMTFRQNIEIDYCPHCRGVWLDRGELDKLIERAHDNRSSAAPDAYVAPEKKSLRKRKRGHDYYDDDRQHHDEYERRGKPRKYQSDKRYRRKKSWKHRGKDVIEEIFDIFD